MQRRKVSDSVPNLKSRGKKTPQMGGASPTPGVNVPEALGNSDCSDYSDGHDKGSGVAKPATKHKGPDRT